MEEVEVEVGWRRRSLFGSAKLSSLFISRTLSFGASFRKAFELKGVKADSVFMASFVQEEDSPMEHSSTFTDDCESMGV